MRPQADRERWMGQVTTKQAVRAVLTDVQFWVPAAVLIGGIVLLVLIH